MSMTLNQAAEISLLAKAKGYCVSAKKGRIRFNTVVYNRRGISTVTPHTEWLTYEEALEILESGELP